MSVCHRNEVMVSKQAIVATGVRIDGEMPVSAVGDRRCSWRGAAAFSAFGQMLHQILRGSWRGTAAFSAFGQMLHQIIRGKLIQDGVVGFVAMETTQG